MWHFHSLFFFSSIWISDFNLATHTTCKPHKTRLGLYLILVNPQVKWPMCLTGTVWLATRKVGEKKKKKKSYSYWRSFVVSGLISKASSTSDQFYFFVVLHRGHPRGNKRHRLRSPSCLTLSQIWPSVVRHLWSVDPQLCQISIAPSINEDRVALSDSEATTTAIVIVRYGIVTFIQPAETLSFHKDASKHN